MTTEILSIVENLENDFDFEFETPFTGEPTDSALTAYLKSSLCEVLWNTYHSNDYDHIMMLIRQYITTANATIVGEKEIAYIYENICEDYSEQLRSTDVKTFKIVDGEAAVAYNDTTLNSMIKYHTDLLVATYAND